MCFRSCARVTAAVQLRHIWSHISLTVSRFITLSTYTSFFSARLFMIEIMLAAIYNTALCFFTDPSGSQTTSEEKLNLEAQELEKRLSMLSHGSGTGRKHDQSFWVRCQVHWFIVPLSGRKKDWGKESASWFLNMLCWWKQCFCWLNSLKV